MNHFLIIDASCYRRREEISLVRRFLLSNRWNEAKQLHQADLVIIFVCAGLRHLVDENLVKIEETSKEMKPGAELIVGGCLPGMDGERLRKRFQGKTITPTNFAALNDLPGIMLPVETMPRIWGPEAICQQWSQPRLRTAARMMIDNVALECLQFVLPYCPLPQLKRTTLRLKRRNTVAFSIAAGCARRCSYCAKPFASGKIRSKPLEAVLKNISEGLRLGYRSFDLYADSIGNYGLDLDTNFGNLLDRILDIRRRFSIGLFDVHPQDFIKYFDSIVRLCQAGKLHYIYVAVQSGNERILKLMKRPCNVKDLATKLVDIRRYDHLFMQTGIIAGFPGETDEEFEDTLRLLERVNFDNVYIHYYCDMPNTESSHLLNKVDKEAMLRRLARIKSASIRHDLAATLREWDCNLAYHASPEKIEADHFLESKSKTVSAV